MIYVKLPCASNYAQYVRINSLATSDSTWRQYLRYLRALGIFSTIQS